MALRTSLVAQPHLYMGDTTGRPLDAGKVYFGEPNKDPEYYPIDIYYDEALTIAAMQPVRTKGGFMNANGDMTEVYASEIEYSVKVLDSYGRQVFYQSIMTKDSADSSISVQLPKPNSIMRTQSSKNSDTVNIMDFGINALVDHTPAFIKAGLLVDSTVYIKEGEYNVNGTIPTNCIFEGQGKVVINLNVSGGNDLNADRGFWLQSGSGMKNVHIKRDVEAPMISGMGDYNGAICIGQYYDPDGVEYKDIVVEDVFLEGVDDGDAQAWSSIFPIIGNVSDVKIKNLKVRGHATFGVMMHWSGDFDWMSPHNSLVTKTYHPRRIEVDGLDIDLTTDIQKTYGIGGIFVSACHDITVDNLRVANCTRPVNVYAGDCGDLAATADSKGKILKNIRFNDTTIINHKGIGVYCDGASLKRVNNTSWLSVANNSDVIFNNLTIERGELAGLDYSLYIDKMSGVTVNGLNLRQDAVYPTQNRPVIYVQSSSGIKINGKTNTLNPWAIFGSRDVTINTNDTCIKPANDSANMGGR
ncbi:hypothetical protein, partial [Psychrobacter sp.]|uniref:hypothetical protein n=1 Tax=Psychrobacter sp. TaxID=56811 RepID=UPI00356B4015